MAIRKHLRANSPARVVYDHDIIWISDDDSSESDDNDGECDLEDVGVDMTTNAGYTGARFEEVVDEANDVATLDRVNSDAQSDSGVTCGLPEEGGAREMEDEGIATDMAPHGDAAGGDRDPHDDEASRAEPVGLDQDESTASGLRDEYGQCGVKARSASSHSITINGLRKGMKDIQRGNHIRVTR